MTPSPSSQEGAVGLKACPFCGGPASLKENVDYHTGKPNGLFWVQCDPCDCFPESCWCKPRDEAIAAWNARPTPDLGDVDELVSKLSRCRELFYEIRMDWSDPRDECREGMATLDAIMERIKSA